MWVFCDTARRLLERLLDKNPKTRATLEELMDDEWVTKEGSEPLPRTTYIPVERLATNVVRNRRHSSRRKLLVKVGCFGACTWLCADARC